MYLSPIHSLKKKRKAQLNGKPELLVLVKQWIHQGFTYLDRTEMYYRLVWEVVPVIILSPVLSASLKLPVSTATLISLFIVHTLNWVFNYNFWTCMTFTFPSVTNPGNDSTLVYLQKMQNRMCKNHSIAGCMIYGSISRGKWHQKSDLDVRILRRPGLLNSSKAYWTVFLERVIALCCRQPLDLYMADSTKFLDKMRADEFPVFLKNEAMELHVKYGVRGKVDLTKIKSLNDLKDNERIKHTLGI